MVKSFVGASINTTIIGIVGYSSEYFPYFQNVVLSICLILQFVFIIFLMNILFIYSYFIILKKYFFSLFRLLSFFIFLAILGNNIYLTWIVFDRIQFILSENGDSKEIRELLLVTSYNEIPNRCNLLLDSYGKKENALLAFIDKDSVSLYIIKENKFINESCR
jgi:hypothetical protein